MKIVVIQSWGFQKLHGGNLRVCFLVKELIKRKHEVAIIHASPEDAEYSRKEFGCRTLNVGVDITRFEPVWSKLFKYSSFVHRARQLTRRMEADVFFGISLINSLVAVAHPRAGSAILYVDFMSNYFKYSHPKGIISELIFRITRRLEEATLEKATRIAMITRTMRDMVDTRHHHKITLISDGADTEMFHPQVDPSRIKDEYGIDNEPIIGYQGGIEPFDGLQFLAFAAPYVVKEVPNVRFLIAGQGTHLKKVKDIIQKNGTSDRFIFTGWIDYRRVPEVLRATTVSVVPIPDCPAMRPLLTFRLLEAMASGTPVVINDLPGAKELVNEEMSFFTRVEDPQKFAATLTQAIMTDKAQLAEMAQKARKRIESLDWRRIGCLDADFVEGERP